MQGMMSRADAGVAGETSTGVLPNCIVIGAAKCGTSSIKTYLGEHPDVFMLHGDEPHFFCRDEQYAKGVAWYRSLFAGAGGKSVVAEGTNAYVEHERYPRTAERMAALLPEARLIYFVRHPLRRIESFWIQLRSHGGDTTPLDFNEAVRKQHERYVDPSNYWRQLSEYLRFYGRERIHVAFLEELEREPRRVMRECFEFVGVDGGFEPPAMGKVINPSKGKRLEVPLMERVRRIPGYDLMRKCLPRSMRKGVKDRILKREFEGRPQWDAGLKRAVCEELGEGTKRFLKWCGKDEGYWEMS